MTIKYLSGSGRTVSDGQPEPVQVEQLELFPESLAQAKHYIILGKHKIAVEVVNDWRGCLHQILLGKNNKQAFYNFAEMNFYPDQLRKHGYSIITPAPHYDHDVPAYRLVKDLSVDDFIEEIEL